MHLREILDRAKSITESDGNTARKLGITDQTISGWRCERTAPNNKQCAKLTELIDVPLAVVIAAAERSRAKTQEDVAFWTRQARKAAATAGTALGALLVACSMMMAPTKADASVYISQIANPGIHIVALLRRLGRRLFGSHKRATAAMAYAGT